MGRTSGEKIECLLDHEDKAHTFVFPTATVRLIQCVTSTIPPARAMPLTVCPEAARTCTTCPSSAPVSARPSLLTLNPAPCDTSRTLCPGWIAQGAVSWSPRNGWPAPRPFFQRFSDRLGRVHQNARRQRAQVAAADHDARRVEHGARRQGARRRQVVAADADPGWNVDRPRRRAEAANPQRGSSPQLSALREKGFEGVALRQLCPRVEWADDVADLARQALCLRSEKVVKRHVERRLVGVGVVGRRGTRQRGQGQQRADQSVGRMSKKIIAK